MWIPVLLCTFLSAFANKILPDEPPASMPTRTVYGFLDFTTTVSNTVMVFKPQSKPTDKVAKKADSPAVAYKKAAKTSPKKKLHAAAVAEASLDAETVLEGSLTTTESQVHVATEGIEAGRSNDGSGVAKLSVYKLKDVLSPINVQVPAEQNRVSPPSDPVQKPLDPNHKLGLISKYGGTVIKHGVTTVHETSVIGTYIDGKYAQIKSSASTVFMAQTTDAVPAKKGSVQVVVEDDPKVRPAVVQAAIAVTAVTPLPPSKNGDDNLPLESLFGMTKPETTTTRKTFKPTPKTTQADQGTIASAKEDFLQRLQRHRQSQSAPDDIEHAETAVKQSFVKPSFRRTTPIPTTEAPEVTTEDRPRYTRRAGYIVSKKRSQNIENDINKASEPSRVVSVRKLQNTGERWRFQPSPKPTLNIQKNRFQQHREEKTTQRTTTTTTTTTEKYDEQDYEEAYNNYSTQDTYSSAEKQEFYDSYDETPEVEPTVVTLHVQTVTPTGYSNIHLEIVTLKSPQVMQIGYSKSTRYLTVTKTSTKHSPRVVTSPAEIESPEFDEPIEPAEPYPEENVYSEERQVESAPVQEEALEEESRGEPEIQPDPVSEAPATIESDFIEPSMSTVTETFSTVELMTKTSVVTYVKGKISTQMTLTQSFYITRLVSAVKTVPAEFLQQNLSETPLDEAGTEHHSRLPTGELNFDEEYDENIPNQKRVIRHPYSSKTDLSDIGNDFDPSEYDKVELEPSLIDTSALLVQPTPPLGGPSAANQQPSYTIEATPTFQDPGSMTPEQIQQLALLRYMNPYAALNPYMNPLSFGLPQINPVVPQVSSRPIVRTSDIMKTDLVPIWNGVSTIYSTLIRKMGVTTVTDYETVTNTAPPNPFVQYTVTSSPVVIDTITTTTDYRTYRIIFRAQTTVTTVTSTSVFPTVVTSYVTSSVQVQPSVFPGLFPGMGGVPFPGFLG